MKNISLALNVVLFVAVVVLYILHFQNKTEVIPGEKKEASDETVVQQNSSGDFTLAFVNTDSVLSGYDYYNKLMDDLQTQQRGAENKYERMMIDFEKEYKSKSVMVQRGVISEEKATQDLAQKQKEIEQYRKNATERLLKKNDELTEEIYNSIIDYVKAHNDSAGYTYIFAKNGAILSGPPAYDLTKEILDGLNSKYPGK